MRALRVLGGLCGVTLSILSPQAHAESADKTFFDIPSQDLSSALRTLSLQADKQLIYSEDIVTGLESPSLRGRYTAHEAIRQILAGTDLGVFETPSGILMIRRSAPEPAKAASSSPPRPATPKRAEFPRATFMEEVLVTASRVQRDGFSAPTPTQVVNAERLEVRGATNVGDALNEMPAFRATVNPQSNGVRAISPGAVFADLRGLGASRTLVLVDGNRFVPQIYTGLGGYQVDLNQIPALMVDRVEVVTGGASAQWGSDAVAGVTNIILKKSFEGFDLEAQRGFSGEDDNRSVRVGLVGGLNFNDNRGNFIIGADYDRNDGVGDVFTRDWGREGWQIVANPGFPDNGMPRQIISPDVRFASASPGGLLIDTALRGTTFDDQGEPVPFVYGEYASSGPTGSMIGGGSNEGLNVNTGLSIRPASERRNVYSRLSYDLSDRLSGYVEASYAYTLGEGQTLPARDFNIPIHRDNPYLPESIRTFMQENGIETVHMGRVHYDLGHQQSEARNATLRFAAGLEGELGSHWDWNVALIHGQNRYRQRVYNNRNRINFALAQDPVYDPVADEIVCRSTLTDPDNGCVPLNLFGPSAVSADARAYVTGTTRTRTVYEQTAANFNVSGEPVSSWAGPVSIATGAEYRREEQLTAVDEIAALSMWESTNAQPLTGDFDVIEGYVETVVPLVTDARLARSLDLNGAVRSAHYSTAAGTQPTWKLGLTWEPTDSVLVRAARSRDIRAPNIYELNTPGVTTRVNVVYGNQPTQVAQITSGNADLQPEKANTSTIGVVWRPGRFRVSADYYEIELEGAITAPAVATVTDGCFEGIAYYCDLITFDGGGLPTTVATPFMNLHVLEREGVDAEFDYTFEPGSNGGLLNVSVHGNWVLTYGTDVGDGLDDIAGEVFGSPKFRGTVNVNYSIRNAMVNAQIRHVGSSKYNLKYVEGVDINDNDVESATYLNLTGAFDVSDNLRVFAVIDNVLDKDPPIAPSVFGYPAQPAFYDMIGRNFRIGLRLQL